MITICISTRNRPALLRRAIKSIVMCKDRHMYKVVIGDASDIEESISHNKETVLNVKDMLDIEYFNEPSLNVVETHKMISSKVTTKYFLNIADGAILVNEGVQVCINFLERNDEFIAVHGNVISFQLKNDSAVYSNKKGIRSLGITPFRELKEGKASQRFDSLMKNYAPLEYLVTRTDAYKKRWMYSDQISHAGISGELLPTSLTCLYGKIGHVDSIMLARHMHENRTRLIPLSEYVFSANWFKDYSSFVSIISNVVSERDMLSISQAADIVSDIIRKYCVRNICSRSTKTDTSIALKILRNLIPKKRSFLVKFLILHFHLSRETVNGNHILHKLKSNYKAILFLVKVLNFNSNHMSA